MSNVVEYVDLDALAIWKEKLAVINEACLEYLDSFEKTSLELGAVWAGNAATGFDENFKKLISDARNHHNELKDVNQFIQTVAETVKSQ